MSAGRSALLVESQGSPQRRISSDAFARHRFSGARPNGKFGTKPDGLCLRFSDANAVKVASTHQRRQTYVAAIQESSERHLDPHGHVYDAFRIWRSARRISATRSGGIVTPQARLAKRAMSFIRGEALVSVDFSRKASRNRSSMTFPSCKSS